VHLAKTVIANDEFDEIIIECSPFVRCIQTASGISKELGIDSVTINWTASELQADWLFEECPVEHTEYLAALKEGDEGLNKLKLKYRIREEL
jgi:broad specificity phosphatase PhoE